MGGIGGKHLTIRKHSPTTIEYSITNKPLASTVHGTILLLLDHLLRLTAGLWGLLIGVIVLYEWWQNWHCRGNASSTITGLSQDSLLSPSSLLKDVMTSQAETWRTAVVVLAIPLQALNSSSVHDTGPIAFQSSNITQLLLWSAIISASLLFFSLRPKTTIESLLVLHTLGLQTSRTVTAFPLLLLLAKFLKKYIGFDFRIPVLFGATTTRFIPTSQIQDVLIHEAFIGWGVRYYLAIVVKEESATVVVFERLLPRLEVVQKVWIGVREVLWEVDKRNYEKEELQS